MNTKRCAAVKNYTLPRLLSLSTVGCSSSLTSFSMTWVPCSSLANHVVHVNSKRSPWRLCHNCGLKIYGKKNKQKIKWLTTTICSNKIEYCSTQPSVYHMWTGDAHLIPSPQKQKIDGKQYWEGPVSLNRDRNSTIIHNSAYLTQIVRQYSSCYGGSEPHPTAEDIMLSSHRKIGAGETKLL